MYYSGILEIDPSQETTIKKVKSGGFISNFIGAVTFGQLTQKQEHETFTAVSILQQIYEGLNSINVSNVIRLSVDDFDFYLDESGEKDDIEKALYSFTSRVDPIESKLFDSLVLVLEHIHESMMYLIEIKVKRKHEVGEYPIEIKVNGVFCDFRLNENETKRDLIGKIEKIIPSQKEYDIFLENMKDEFVDFLDILEHAAKKHIRVDNIVKKIKACMIKPKTEIEKPSEIPHFHKSQPIHYGYYGIDDYFFYCWIWGVIMNNKHFYCSNFYLTDEEGNEIMKTGTNGFLAGKTGVLLPSPLFEEPQQGELIYFYGNIYEKQLIEKGLLNKEN